MYKARTYTDQACAPQPTTAGTDAAAGQPSGETSAAVVPPPASQPRRNA